MNALRAAVQRCRELGPGLFGLACSGGADSIALADAAIAELGAPHVVLIHIDHGLSPGSARVADEVAAWARGQGVAVVARRVEVDRRASLEAAAREARYAALSAIANEVGAAWVLLGHTARDQAETVLMRIVRGTGPAGLAGIPERRDRFVRPLLGVQRQDVDSYIAARGLPTWDDPMNTDRSIARVRFREVVLPALRTENPAVDEALCRLAANAREWLDALDEVARPLASLPVDCTVLAAAPAAIRKRAYSLALDREGLGFDAVHLDAIDELVMRPARGEVGIDVPGARVVRSYDRLELRTHDGPSGARPTAVVGGPAPDLSGARPTDGRPGAAHDPSGGRPDDLAVPDGYELRTWRPGDRMKPARLGGRSRKLSDLYIDAKVPRERRRTARVLVRSRDQSIVWAEHLGIAFGESPDLVQRIVGRTGSF
jgi:tRNA(Ile)-lysidine synthase